jgi:hypothetical protein
MLDFFFIVIALGLGAAGGGKSTQTAAVAAPAQAQAPAVAAAVPGGSDSVGGLLEGTDETMPSGNSYVAEPQVPTGKFTTATEIKPIMTATKGNWVAVREYDGRDLVYLTQVLSWRCGLVGVRVALNGGPMQDWPLPPCQIDTAQPNAIPQDAKIYESYPLKSVNALDVEIIYDDLSRDSAHFERNQVLMP